MDVAPKYCDAEPASALRTDAISGWQPSGRRQVPPSPLVRMRNAHLACSWRHHFPSSGAAIDSSSGCAAIHMTEGGVGMLLGGNTARARPAKRRESVSNRGILQRYECWPHAVALES